MTFYHLGNGKTVVYDVDHMKLAEAGYRQFLKGAIQCQINTVNMERYTILQCCNPLNKSNHSVKEKKLLRHFNRLDVCQVSRFE